VKPQTYGFGVDPIQNSNHFYVWIPSKDKMLPPDEDKQREEQYMAGNLNVQVYERYAWSPDGEQILGIADKLRIDISKRKWQMVKDTLTTEFNARLKKEGLRVGKFTASGGVPVERLFGKEIMVLLWAIEDCDPGAVSTAIRNWKGLMPEERWWLYTMTNAATGELHDKKGWRKALRFALCENPVVERQQMSLFDAFEEEAL
jgi:hypothetical protein